MDVHKLDEDSQFQALHPTVPSSLADAVAAAHVQMVNDFRDLIGELVNEEDMREGGEVITGISTHRL